MKTIETIIQEINQVMELVDETELEQALPLFQKKKKANLCNWSGSQWISSEGLCDAFDAYRLHRLCNG
jgi:DNA-binding MurR/RpiR family transcriptional regulator